MTKGTNLGPRFPVPAIAVGCVTTFVTVLLYVPWLVQPHIRYDDFSFLTKSRTWTDTMAHLWLPMNEHVMPLSRLAAGLLMQVVDRQSMLPLAAQIHGIGAVVAGMWLLYAFLKRELGHPFYAAIGMTLWGVTSSYYENVTWYSASFFTLALDMTLVGLLAAQWYQRSGHTYALGLCVLCCALAPAFHGTAVLAGAWCTIYLIAGRRDQGSSGWQRVRGVAILSAPLLGSLTFVVTSLVASEGGILNPEHYGGRSTLEAFNAVEGIQNTLRTIADNQIPGAFGIWDRHSTYSWPVVLTIVSVVAGLGVMWWRTAPCRALLALGLAVVLGSDLLVYGARADWSYDRSVHNWTRYHLFPHLGIVLFVTGGLPAFDRRWFTLSPSGRLSVRQALTLFALIAVAFACHRPRSYGSHFPVPGQLEVLRRVERVDARCRAMKIDGATARQALEFLQLPLGFDGNNAWELLRGSDRPISMTAEKARVLLAAALD